MWAFSKATSLQAREKYAPEMSAERSHFQRNSRERNVNKSMRNYY